MKPPEFPGVSPADAGGQPSAIDHDRLASLAQLAAQGGPDLMTELREVFEQSTRHQVAELREAIARRDLSGVAVAAHTLKGTAANFGADRLADFAADLDQRARRGELPHGPEAAEVIARLRNEAVDAVRREWSRLVPPEGNR